jgi:hypothetical protein
MLSKSKSHVHRRRIVIEQHTVKVTEHQFRKYEVFCDENQDFDSDIHPEKPMLQIVASPSELADRFASDREEILRCVRKLKENFRDSEQREIDFVNLKCKLSALRDKVALPEFGLLRSINMCIDAIDNTRAELLTKKQIDNLESVLKLINEASEDFEVNLLQDILMKSGLKPIPNIDGIAELY